MNGILLAIMLLAAAPTFEVQTLDGQTLLGPLAELSPQRLSVDTSGGRVSLPTERLLSISAKQRTIVPQKTAGVVVELTDGSTILARQYAMQGSRAWITLSAGEVLETPASAVRTVQLQRQSGVPASEWARLADVKADGDLLAVRKDQSIDYHKGVLHEVTEDTVRFEVDGEVLPVRRSKVLGFAYRHVAAELPPATCRITDSSGSQWSARSLSLSDGFQWTTPAGLEVSQAAEEIVEIDFSGGKVVYLSDLKPEKVGWTPYFGTGKRLPAVERFYAPRHDRNFESAPLQTGGTQYRKGLALYSRTEIVYRLPERFSRFRAVAGIDDAVRPGGKVRLLVRGDGKDLLDLSIAGSDPPRPIELDLSGVRRLAIVVDFSDSLGVGDYLLLCDARLFR